MNKLEISSDKLKKLNCWEYEELKILKEKKLNFLRIFKWFPPIIFLAFHITLLIYFLRLQNSYIVGFAVFAFFISTPIFILAVEGEFDDYYQILLNFFLKRTNTYTKINELESYFTPIEKEIEDEAIIILDSIDEEAKARLSKNRGIHIYLWRKRNPNLYLYEIEKARKNYELNQDTLTIINNNIEFIKFNLSKRKHFKDLQRNLQTEYVKWLHIPTATQNIVYKLSTIKTKFSSKFDRRPTTIRNEELFASKEKKVKPADSTNLSNEVIKFEKTPQKNTNTGISKKNSGNDKITTLIKDSNTNSPEKNKQLKLNFENPKLNAKPVNEIPSKRKTPKHQRIIKVSDEYYLKVADRNMKIGKKGEFMVMEYEKQRLLAEGENIEKRLQHSSVEVGDGLGFDIRSFENEKEIYIEVKTTTGSFWANLFFTQNEYEKMNEFGEQYYLYRICNFDTETNLGDLFIFKGKEMIESYFEFNSKMYVLTQK